jgi:hypothetical protein
MILVVSFYCVVKMKYCEITVVEKRRLYYIYSCMSRREDGLKPRHTSSRLEADLVHSHLFTANQKSSR